MERKEIIPDWPGSPFEQYAKNFCAKNAWRVRNVVGDYSDCLAECALAYVQCRKQYGATVKEVRQFMFFYVLWINAIFDTWSVKDSKRREAQQKLVLPREPIIESDAVLQAKLSTASPELKRVVDIFMKAPQEMMDVLRKDATSCNPKQFFKAVLRYLGIPTSESIKLSKELTNLLK